MSVVLFDGSGEMRIGALELPLIFIACVSAIVARSSNSSGDSRPIALTRRNKLKRKSVKLIIKYLVASRKLRTSENLDPRNLLFLGRAARLRHISLLQLL